VNILLVDDDVVDRKLIKRALRNDISVTNIHEVSSAVEGLEIAQSGSFDVLLLDYMMPEIDGIEMVITLRARADLGKTAIVMMSSSEDDDVALSCLHAGAQDFIKKSEITSSKLKRSILQAKKRFEMEKKLHDSFCQVRELAEKDSLTGLSNRYHFEDALKISLDNNIRTKQIISLLFLDLDHFKNINDTYGHDMGDLVLKEVVARINHCLRGNELFARIGGDEFAILLTGLKSEGDPTFVATRIIKALSQPLIISGHELQCGVSIGIALCPNNATTTDALMKYADIAMYRAKKEGRNRFCYFKADMQMQFSRHYQIETALKKTLEDQSFQLHYQPVVNSMSKKLEGAEALIRWPNSPFQCFPDEFIPIAEQSRIIDKIGEWVLDTAIKQLSVWQKISGHTLSMAVNISAIQFSDDKFIPYIQKKLEYYQVPAERLILEITETALFVQSDDNSKHIKQLSDLGCKLALDDFGTGFSSLSHLINFPIDIVKLDKSLFPSSMADQRHLTIVKGIAAMINTIGLEIVAEGVETQFQQELCQELDIDTMQGYLFDEALNAADFESKWLSKL